MKKQLLALLPALILFHFLPAQMVAKMQVNFPLPGACDSTKVYALFPGFGDQVAPVPPMSKKEIEAKLNSDVQFIKDNPKFKGKLMINCIINCKGEMIKCMVDNKSGDETLDQQVLAIFLDLKKWTPGKLNGSTVDCSELFSIEVKKGKITVS